ncbi:hypothetical protein DL93DRAFT_2054522 [Clavulina sp. PMI_390]|nr:hypothetical protein DL93DRAFT_2054522 [Clavulina sp. PMI_390]
MSSTFASRRESTTSITSSVSIAKKMRPESVVLNPGSAKLILGLAVVDFNHLLGPTVEMAHPKSILEDEEMCKILPFLALPDGAHLNQEDYSYFHVVPTQPGVFGPEASTSTSAVPKTVFGISCNRQIAASDLLSKNEDVTRSTVQKAIVVLAAKPLFGLIRDKLGVVTRAFFNQRDFRDDSILVDFCDGLESSIRAQLTESGVYMGQRELVYTFRHRTLMLLKLLMLQKKVMFYGHPVERLCTYQYSLISLIPGLMMALEDCGSPELAERAPTLSRATEFKSSDRQSLLKFMGLPLDLFGKGAFFQPYMPLQQIDLMAKSSYLCGSTNSILTHQRDHIDLIINIETNTFEFMDPLTERLVALTPADRQWMDDIVHDVTDSWNENDPGRPLNMQFKGSDDYLRVKFEDYLCGVLSALKYTDFLQKSAKGNVTVAGATGDAHVMQNFGEVWLAAFRQTEAYTVWDRITDPVIFDIVEPRHPCDIKVNAISDLGLRLTEGIHDLGLDKNIESTGKAISSAFSTGSTSIFKAFEGVRSEVSSRLAAQRNNTQPTGASNTSPSLSPLPSTTTLPPSSSPKPATAALPNATPNTPDRRATNFASSLAPPQPVNGGGLRPLSLVMSPTLTETAQAARSTLGSWGSGIGSFFASRAAKAAPAAAPAASGSGTGTSTPENGTSRASSIVHVEPASTRPSASRINSSSSNSSLRSFRLSANPAMPPLPSGANTGKHISGSSFVASPSSSPTIEIRDLDKEREEREKDKP